MSTNAAFRTPSGAIAYLHWDGYPSNVVPSLAAAVAELGAEAALAMVMEFDWDVLLDDPINEPKRVLTPGEDLPGYIRWVYDLDMDGVTVTHPCDYPACSEHQRKPERMLWATWIEAQV